MATNNPISFRSQEIFDRLNKKDRASVHDRAKTELLRYFQLLKITKRKLNFNLKELAVFCDAFNGTLFSDLDQCDPAEIVRLEILSSLKYNALDLKWKIDKNIFVEKIKNLSSAEALAIVDSVEIFWKSSEISEEENIYSQIILAFDKDSIAKISFDLLSFELTSEQEEVTISNCLKYLDPDYLKKDQKGVYIRFVDNSALKIEDYRMSIA